MNSTGKLGAMALAAMLVLSVLAPAALAATAAGNTAGNVSVETTDAENVTNSSAELHGEIEELDENESATVYFTYWVEGDEANATDTASATTDEDTEFKETVTGLQNNTTYVYVAKADVNNTTVSGEEVSFTTGEEYDGNSSDAFGQEVSAFVHDLLEDRDDSERGIGQMVSEFVTENNPGADKRPEHAGPPEDRGPDADTERGPPEDKGPDWKDDSDDTEDSETEDAETEEDTQDDHPGNGNANGKK